MYNVDIRYEVKLKRNEKKKKSSPLLCYLFDILFKKLKLFMIYFMDDVAMALILGSASLLAIVLVVCYSLYNRAYLILQ